jgi:hypothetical protein
MKCERCLRGKEATYRVYTDVIDMKVCAACADEARELGLAVEVLGTEKNRGVDSEFECQDFPSELLPWWSVVTTAKL